MPSPTLAFAFILATLYGAAFHLIFGGDVRRMAVFLLASWIGFALGHIIGVMFAIDIFNIGALRIVSATLGALVALVATGFLTSKGMRKRSAR